MALSIAHAVVENLLVVCAGDNTPTDEEFGQMVQTITTLDEGVTGLLIVAGSKRPTPQQRAEMVPILKRRGLRVALVSNSRLARGAITAMGWFVQAVKSFEPTQIEQALAHLGIREEGAARVLAKLRELQAQVPGATAVSDTA